MSAHIVTNNSVFSTRIAWQLTIVFLFLTTCCLGFPQFHYTAALMIAVILRYKDTPGDIFTPIR